MMTSADALPLADALAHDLVQLVARQQQNYLLMFVFRVLVVFVLTIIWMSLVRAVKWIMSRSDESPPVIKNFSELYDQVSVHRALDHDTTYVLGTWFSLLFDALHRELVETDSPRWDTPLYQILGCETPRSDANKPFCLLGPEYTQTTTWPSHWSFEIKQNTFYEVFDEPCSPSLPLSCVSIRESATLKSVVESILQHKQDWRLVANMIASRVREDVHRRLRQLNSVGDDSDDDSNL